MTCAELLARISSRELAEWQAYLRLEEDGRKQTGLNKRAAAGLKKTKK